MGYGGIILHGVFAYNNIAHDFVRQLGQGQPSSLREISARFAGPVKPGDQVKVDVWRIGATRDGLDDIRWTAAVESTGRLCLSDGRAKVKCPASASKL
jgi:acyl dehydratase